MTVVVDDSVAVKWVVQEADTPEALALRSLGGLAAPELLVAECANILRKKVLRGEVAADQAALAAVFSDWPASRFVRWARCSSPRCASPSI